MKTTDNYAEVIAKTTGIPSIDYLSCILTGARGHGLPEEYACWLERIGTMPEVR